MAGKQQCWNEDAMCRAVEEIEGHTVELLLYFDLIFIQTRPCSVHDEQDTRNEAHSKVDEEIKCPCIVAQPLAIRMKQRVCIAMNYTLCHLKVG
jgi:hypothetical protein